MYISWSLHCYLHFCYEIFLLVTRSSQKNTRFNRKCSRHPRKCNLLPAIRSILKTKMRSFALVCADLRSFCTLFAHFCARFGGNLTMEKKKTRPNGISARIVKKRSSAANGRQKVLRRVNFGIEQGGRQKFMLRWRFQDIYIYMGVAQIKQGGLRRLSLLPLTRATHFGTPVF